jgi:hypothetical protein
MKPKLTMKKSHLFMLAGLGILGMFVIALVGLSRGSISYSESGETGARVMVDFNDQISGNYDIKDFHTVVLNGAWEVDLIYGDDWEIELSYPRELENEIGVIREGNRLVLDSSQPHVWAWNWFNKDHGSRTFSARITMPELREIDIKGTSDLEFSGFEGDKLIIVISGAGNVEGEDGHYEELSVTMSGAGNVDARDVIVVDADVTISGAGNITLNMDGGVLSGDLSGFGNIEYFGSITEERVNISGFGDVGKRMKDR